MQALATLRVRNFRLLFCAWMVSTTLLAGAAWVVGSTVAVCNVPDVRDFRMRETAPTSAAVAAEA